MSQTKFPTKCVLNFHVFKINRMMLFCNLFMEQALYYCDVIMQLPQVLILVGWFQRALLIFTDDDLLM